jgi:hypothetical protein
MGERFAHNIPFPLGEDDAARKIRDIVNNQAAALARRVDLMVYELIAQDARPLLRLMTSPCESGTRGTCADDESKSPDAPYLADRYCWPCRLRAAIGPLLEDERPEGHGWPRPIRGSSSPDVDALTTFDGTEVVRLRRFNYADDWTLPEWAGDLL